VGDGTAVRTVTFEPGFIILDHEGGQRERHPVADVLRVLDIPVGLTYTQVASISALANMFAILIRTLIDRQVLDESFLENDDYSLQALVEAIEAMGGSYAEPSIEDADA